MPTEIAFPSTFLAKPFLSLEPDAVDAQAADRVVRGARAVSALSGAANTEIDPAPPILRRSYTYHCTSRAEIGALRAFFRARKARSEAFWFLDWQMDLVVDSYFDTGLGAGSLVYTVPRATSDGVVSYGASLFPLGAFYRYLVFVRGLEWALSRVTAVAQDTPAGSGLEELTISTLDNSAGFFSPGVPYTMARGYRPLWLRYGRFDTDTLSLEVHSSDEAIAVLPILDLPGETPA